MKIALIGGGLGNQTFQYIFSRWMELATGEPCYLDDCSFFFEKAAHNGYEMERVFPDSRPRLLSRFFQRMYGPIWYLPDETGGRFVSRLKIWEKISLW